MRALSPVRDIVAVIDWSIAQFDKLVQELMQVFGMKEFKCILCEVNSNLVLKNPSRIRFAYFIVFFAILSLGASYLDLDQVRFERIADAIYVAEGGRKASVPYGIFYKGCDWDNPAYCRHICINTLRNTYKRWISSKSPLSYLEFLRDRYCPLSHSQLNANWLPNLRRIYGSN